MYLAHTKKGEPFRKGALVPYGPLPLEPASTILNYGQGIFEGLKGMLFSCVLFIDIQKFSKNLYEINNPFRKRSAHSRIGLSFSALKRTATEFAKGQKDFACRRSRKKFSLMASAQ